MSCKHPQANPARAVLILGLIAALAPPVAFAQDTQQQDPAAAPMQSVVVTGTRSLNRRTLDSESPVDVISNKELLSTGSGELATVLARLLPSMNFPRPSGADASDAVRPAQLRGLSPDQTLVLVNGKRRHASAVVNVNGTLGRGSAPVDLNAIPLAAIDHIEVLRDGAAAQYGSDAIAGVVNVILKKGAKGGEAEVVYGQYDKGDGESATVRGSAGFELGQDGWVRVAVEAADRKATNRSFADPRPSAGPRQGTVTQRYGDPDSRPAALFVNSQVKVNDAVDWYAFASYGERETSSAATFRTAYTDNNRTALRSQPVPGGLPAAARQHLHRRLDRDRPARRTGRLALGCEPEPWPQPLFAGRRQHGQLQPGRDQPDRFLCGRADLDAEPGQPGRGARDSGVLHERSADGGAGPRSAPRIV